MQTIHTIGRRKTSVARIYLKEGNGIIEVLQNNNTAKKNGEKIKKINYKNYFSYSTFSNQISSILSLTNSENKFNILIKVKGGGINGQVEAVRLAICRALCLLDSNNRSLLKPKGFLTRDSRKVERKKFGQKKARKQFQFSKR